MTEVLTRAMCFIAIILLGFVLRRVGFFKAEDFGILSKIAIRITLPASIIYSFSGKEFDPALLGLALISFGMGVVYMGLGWLMYKSREDKAFGILNTAGYNIGNFALPFTQSFLGAAGVIATSVFDVGNACVCLGTSYAVASVVKDGSGFDLRRLGKALLTSVPFLTYILMVTLKLLKLELPGPVVECAGIIGNANAFLAMLMIGVGFNLKADRSQLGQVAKILVTRYTVAAVLAVLCWNLLPFAHSIRMAVVILLFSPIASAAPAYTGELGGNTGLSAAVNSISILCSIPIIVILLLVLL